MTHIEIQQQRSASCIALCMHVRMLTPGCPFSVDNSCGYAKADHDEAAAAGRASQFQDVRKGGIFEDEQDGEESSATSQLVAAYQVSIPGLRRNHEAHYSVRLGPPHSRLGSALAREAPKEADKIEWSCSDAGKVNENPSLLFCRRDHLYELFYGRRCLGSERGARAIPRCGVWPPGVESRG
jgi:hypothetical protein